MEEPNTLIRWVIYLFGGGDAALIAICGLGAIATLPILRPHSRFARPQFWIAAVFILIAVLCCGSPPFPLWFMIGSLLGLVGIRVRLLQVRYHQSPLRPTRIPHVVAVLPIAWTVLAIGLQIPYLVWRDPDRPISQTLIIGDSITAGLNDGDKTWPRQLAEIVNVRITDVSQPGATLKSARTQNVRLRESPGLLILEIGGNDLLEGLAVDQFESDLDQLLEVAVRPDRSVVMFELPLPPLCARYGEAQRKLARKHGARLIPKRRFAQVLTTAGATVDGIHLSTEGHLAMANLFKHLFSNQLHQGTGIYRRIDR